MTDTTPCQEVSLRAALPFDDARFYSTAGKPEWQQALGRKDAERTVSYEQSACASTTAVA